MKAAGRPVPPSLPAWATLDQILGGAVRDMGTTEPETQERPEALARAGRLLGASLPLFKLAGIRVRLHWSFALAGVILAAWTAAGAPDPGEGARLVAWGFVEAAILYVLVFVHELAHAGAAMAAGARPFEIVLTPLGGTAIVDGAMTRPATEAGVALAGPCANLVLVALSVALCARSGLPDAWGRSFTLHAAAGFAFWASLWLAVLNLLPAFPLDGGRAARALASWRLGERRGTILAARSGEALALGMSGLGLWWGGPPAVVLCGIGVSNLLACEAAIRALESGLGVYDEPPRGARRSGRSELDPAGEGDEFERRVDELLEKVARGGLSSLSFSERRFLRRASRRYREQEQKQPHRPPEGRRRDRRGASSG